MESGPREPSRFLAAFGTLSARRRLASFFDTSDGDDQKLAATGVLVLQQAPEIADLVELATRVISIEFNRLRVLDDPLVHSLLRRTILTDLPLEQLFTTIRRSFLERVQTEPDSLMEHLPLAASLACQCFNNQYVYSTTPAEEASVDCLRSVISETIATGDSARLKLQAAVYGMYRSLYSLDCHRDLQHLGGELEEVTRRQIAEPLEEQELKGAIRSFGAVADPISQSVRQQYEDYPYPRWLNLKMAGQKGYRQSIAAKIPFLEPPETSHPQILIAGCGTGQHPLSIARRNPDSSVVAVDFSLPSLACALRQARRHGIANVEFLHGDLLCIDQLGKTFDCIEAVGVLHHMDDPRAGLKALVQVLRPGGLLRVGLYSKRGLAPLREVQDLCNATIGSDRSAENVRRARRAISEQASKLGFVEFFYLSGIPDLFCPAHAQHFTPLEVNDLIDGLNLEFLCYEKIPDDLMAIYRGRFPDDPYLRDLHSIDLFEQDFPIIFKSLHSFWLQKRQ